MSSYYAAPPGVALRAMVPGAMWGASHLRVTLRDPAATSSGGAARSVVELLRQKEKPVSARWLRRTLQRPVWDVLQRLARSGTVTIETVPPSLGPGPRVERVVVLARSLPSLLDRDRVFGRARRQREAYETLDQLGGEVALPRLLGELGFSRSVISGLADRGLARIDCRAIDRDPFRSRPSEDPPPTPTPDQARAVAGIQALEPGERAVLFGVTGSGKTLVYLSAIAPEVRAGRGAIVLVPEIALTPQTVARVRGAFGDQVAVLHSGLSDGERVDAWWALARGDKRVVVGARSAVFAPVRDVAAIVVDEEHDPSYKNGEAPRYHARDVARLRGRIEGTRVILGSATPALETWAARETIRVLRLPERATVHPLPPVELVDLRAAPLVAGSGAVPWSEALDAAVTDRLDRGAQVLLLLNRRGFAHYLECSACGAVVECPSCSIALTVHQTPVCLRCHYCGHERAIPATCPECGGATHRTRGVGTQALERWLGERFPTARLARMDADTTSTKWSHARILDAFARGEIDILFGTQMISKGLDFPNVTLVGVVQADTSLHLPDFRASERTFQLVAQVAGRSGRGGQGGVVMVQTRAPDHYALQLAAVHDYEAFADRELEERRRPAYPPHVALINVVASGEHEPEVARTADRLAEWFRGLVETRSLPVDVLGPAPAPLAKLQGRWRWHVLLRSADQGVLGRVLRFAAHRAPGVGRGQVRIAFDRDPVSLL